MTGNDCRRVQQLWLDEAEGRPLSSDDRTLLQQHRETCLFCRAEEDWVHAAGHDARTGPAPELDDLACRRWVDEVLDRVEEAPREDAARPNRRVVLWGAAAAILLLTLSAALWGILQGPTTPDEPVVDGGAVLTPPDHTALLLLLSGGQANIDGRVPAVGDTLASNARLTVDGGRAVVQLQDGLRVSLESGSFSFEPAAEAGVSIKLDAGKLYLLANPERPGGPIDVASRTGTVRITGTYLSVEDDGTDIAVEVYRGSVQVAGTDDTRLQVIGGQRHLIGSDQITAFSDETGQRARQVQDLLQLLGHSRYTTVDVRSIPDGATVSLDGCPLGPTPLTAHVVAGLHKLELEEDEYVPSREFIQLDDGASEERTIELLPLTDVDAAPDSTSTAAAIAAVATPTDGERAAQLLLQAQAHRTERNWGDAAATYRTLTERYPQTPEARASWVSLGTIQLDHLGQPEQALTSFDSYLDGSPGGSLTQEASFERARALRAMGDRQQEVAAWQRFIEQFPDALEAPLARQYLEQAP